MFLFMHRRKVLPPTQIEPTIAQLAQGRQAALAVCRQLSPTCEQYLAAKDAIEAIDGLVGALTGDREYFHLKGHG